MFMLQIENIEREYAKHKQQKVEKTIARIRKIPGYMKRFEWGAGDDEKLLCSGF